MISGEMIKESTAIGTIRKIENKTFDRIKMPGRGYLEWNQTKADYYKDIEIFIYSLLAQKLMKHCNVQPVNDEPYRWKRMLWYSRGYRGQGFVPSIAKRIPFIGIPRNQVEPQDMLDRKYFNLIYKVQFEAVWIGIRDFLRIDESDWDEYEIERMFNPLKVTYDSNRRYRCLPLREEKKTEKTKAQVDWYNNFMMKKQEEKDVIHS